MIEDAMREKTVLLECKNIAQLPKVIDHFKENYTQHIFTSHLPGIPLRQLMVNLGKNTLPESEVRKVLFALLSIVKYLHDNSIKHCNINFESVVASRKDGRLHIKLDRFQNAIFVYVSTTQNQADHA